MPLTGQAARLVHAAVGRHCGPDAIASELLSLRTQANKNAGQNQLCYMVMLLIALAKWEINAGNFKSCLMFSTRAPKGRVLWAWLWYSQKA